MPKACHYYRIQLKVSINAEGMTLLLKSKFITKKCYCYFLLDNEP
jgi:hypothetical protein